MAAFKGGTLPILRVEALDLPVPSTKDVLSKRVDFVKAKLADEPVSRDRYFLSKGIRLNVQSIQAFAATVEEIFISTDYVSRAISWLCNFDVRRSLHLSQRVLLSPHVGIDDLVKTFISGERLRISPGRIKRALFLGDYNHFRQEDSSFVLNIFSVFPEMVGSPLAKASVLQLLKDRDAEALDNKDAGYMEVGEVVLPGAYGPASESSEKARCGPF